MTSQFMAPQQGRAVPAMLRITVGPIAWEILDATAYATLTRAWRHAAQLLAVNPAPDDLDEDGD